MLLFFEDDYIRLADTDGQVETMKGREKAKVITPKEDGRVWLKIEYELFFNDRSGKLYWNLHLRVGGEQQAKTLPLSPTGRAALSGPFIIEKVEMEMDESLKEMEVKGGKEIKG